MGNKMSVFTPKGASGGGNIMGNKMRVFTPKGASGGGAQKPGTSQSGKSRFKEGDKVKISIDVDILKMIEDNRGGWDDRMAEVWTRLQIYIYTK